MIRKTEKMKKLEEGLANSKVRRRLRKQEAAQFKYQVSRSLDPKKYTWNKSCKKGCYGRGYVGVNSVTGALVLCRCAKSLTEPDDQK